MNIIFGQVSNIDNNRRENDLIGFTVTTKDRGEKNTRNENTPLCSLLLVKHFNI